ncbi:unnamed protein product [Hymenolepis diminuta]|uniref:Fibronectin type-III domain-containing protein n=1 Tax=Hymenolepis diminuta TaxID=6216 RepID=A0A564Z6P6_HYMDI|nr:unnamed protein product [Hymenolepis diminuta]
MVHPDLTELGDCDESESKCTASNLSAGTVYTAHLIVCFNDTTNGGKICSEKSPKGVSCATSPNPPTNVQVKPNSADSVLVTIDVPNVTTGIARYSACIDMTDSSCIDLEGVSDTRSGVIGDLSPATEYLLRSLDGPNPTVSLIKLRFYIYVHFYYPVLFSNAIFVNIVKGSNFIYP